MNAFGQWNGIDKYFEWMIQGHMDSNYAKNPDNQNSTILKWIANYGKKSTQKVVTLSVTKAELYAATSCTQDMIFEWTMMQAMDLKIKLPVIHNNGTIDLSRNWSMGGKTQHVDA